MIYIGTSGWHYDHWRGVFYPSDLPPRRFLGFYGQVFGAVEVNSAFYRLPTAAAIQAWRQEVPPGFVFAVKASRLITHLKKLQGVEAALAAFLDRLSGLGPALGPILLQLPPRFHFQPARLETFLAGLPCGYRYAMELRDPTWLVPAASAILARHGVAFCIYDFAGRQSPLEVTSDFVYVRLHGPAGAYQGCYGDAALQTWARRLGEWAAGHRDVFCFFDNDEAGYAARNALTLQTLIRSPGPWG